MSVQTSKRMANKTYPERIPLYDTPEGKRILQVIARRRQCGIASAIRQMVREEAARVGIAYSDEVPESSP